VCSEALGASEDGVCENAPAGYVGAPACEPDACTGESPDCEPCTTDAHCPSGAYCADGGACTPDKRKGATCDDAAGGDCEEDGCRVCAGDLPCVDGVCCDTACDGACDACSEALGAGADGTCTVLEEGTGEPTCRNGFACDGSGPDCPAECETDASCRASHYCSAQGTCEPRNCDAATDCGEAAPYCVDGICCDEPCTGQCEACDVTQREGLCSPVTGTPHGDRTSCVAEGEECGGTCDGDTRARCTYGAAGTACGTPSCSDGTAEASSCDGRGACVAAEPVTCSPYACGADGCLDGCTVDDDCASGYSCIDGSCLFSGGRCSEDGKQALDGDGALVKECEPYTCVNGQCAESCTSTSDCQRGFVCDTAAERCIATASDVTDEGGCACRTTGRGSSSSAWLVALAFGAACLLRRRALRASSS
jgi:MYXO-CTERM domain-containing protein